MGQSLRPVGERQHATLSELSKRGRESDAVSIGILVNERSFLDKQYMQEPQQPYAGNDTGTC